MVQVKGECIARALVALPILQEIFRQKVRRSFQCAGGIPRDGGEFEIEFTDVSP